VVSLQTFVDSWSSCPRKTNLKIRKLGRFLRTRTITSCSLVFNRSFSSFSSATSTHSEHHRNSSNTNAGFTYQRAHKTATHIEADLTLIRVLQLLFQGRDFRHFAHAGRLWAADGLVGDRRRSGPSHPCLRRLVPVGGVEEEGPGGAHVRVDCCGTLALWRLTRLLFSYRQRLPVVDLVLEAQTSRFGRRLPLPVSCVISGRLVGVAEGILVIPFLPSP
jgi:hypothetical protein